MHRGHNPSFCPDPMQQVSVWWMLLKAINQTETHGQGRSWDCLYAGVICQLRLVTSGIRNSGTKSDFSFGKKVFDWKSLPRRQALLEEDSADLHILANPTALLWILKSQKHNFWDYSSGCKSFWAIWAYTGFFISVPSYNLKSKKARL